MGGTISPEYDKQIRTVVRRVLRSLRNSVPTAAARDRVGYHEGYADGDISSGTGGNPTSGFVKVWADDADGTWTQLKHADGTDLRIEVQNKWDTTISDNTYVHIQKVGRYWQVVAASCSAEA